MSTGMGPSDLVRVTVIDPVISPDDRVAKLPEVPGLELQRVSLRYGTTSIESRWDDEFAVPGVIDAAIRAERSGAQAVVINCMDDPGVAAAREVVRIPVVGPAETSMHLALCLADRFTIVTTSAVDIPVVREMVERYQLLERCASVRALGLPVLALHDDPAATFRAYTQVAVDAVEEDGAAALISGCTLLSPFTSKITDHLAHLGLGVPVIDPIEAALRHAVSLVRLGITHSQKAYPAPAAKLIVWPDVQAYLGPAISQGEL